MSIYTGTGDGGKTSLFSGERVSKTGDRIEAVGCVDELSSHLGVLASALAENNAGWVEQIRRIQSDLMTIGSHLATTGPATGQGLKPIDEGHSRFLESAIDRMEADLEPLRNFILPGGCAAAAQAHVARAVCRRAERRALSARGEGDGADDLARSCVYLNRLSDYLFVLARRLNADRGVADPVRPG